LNKEINPILKNLIPFVEGLANTIGKNCEVVLHDLEHPQKSIVAISNGHVTDRKVGGPMTEMGLKAIRNKEYEQGLIKYKTITNHGRTLKSSTFFIKDLEGKVIGCLCINMDITELLLVKNIIDDMAITVEPQIESPQADETYGSNINDILYNVVERVIAEFGKPIAYLNKEEKVQIVKQLDEKGMFLIKGAVDYIAEILCVSRYTIYNYLDEIRDEKY
jgi:predicted transcriptional regulator YheO